MKLNHKSKFEDLVAEYLKQLESKGVSKSYIIKTEEALLNHAAPLANIRLNKLDPVIIQDFFDGLDRREKVVKTYTPKPDVIAQYEVKTKDIVAAGITTEKCACYLLNGKRNSSEDKAIAFAKLLNAPVETLFEITETRGKYAWNTTQHIKGAVRACLASAKKKRIIPDNFATSDFIDFPKRTQNDIVCMDEEQISKALKVAFEHEDIRHTTVFILFVFTGFRRGEGLALTWDDVDFINREISVSKSVTRVQRYGIIQGDPKTKKSKRKIRIPQILADQLVKYKAWYDKLKEEMGELWAKNQNHLFINSKTGARISPEEIITWLNKTTQKAGLGHWTVHSFRHTNITMKLSNNVPLLVVAGEAGHSKTSTTTDKYGHFLNTHRDAAPNMMDNLFGKITPPEEPE